MLLPPFLTELMELKGDPGPFTLRQTHISWLLFGPDFVYKIKKPVDLGFLDFRSLQQRKHFCEEEVRLNRRLSPDVYLGVSEIRRLGGTVGLFEAGGPGELIDYAVTMRHLPDSGFLNVRLAEERISDEDLVALARMLSDFHRRADSDDRVRACGDPRSVRRNITDNFAQTKPFAGSLYPLPWHIMVSTWSEQFIYQNLKLFGKRQSEGFIRECHGDLHSGNLCLDEAGFHCIDCIEFTDRFRCIDVVADMAFLLMDLEHAGHHRQAGLVQEAYLEDHGDPDFLTLLPFYKVYRAWVRGKVEALTSKDLDQNSEAYGRMAKEALSYFSLALRYVLEQLGGPRLIITCGLMGTGKSVLSRWLGEALDVPVLISDEERKKVFAHLLKEDPSLGRHTDWNKGLYSRDNIAKVYDHLFEQAREHLSAGRSLILDASFGKEHWRQRARDLAKAMGVPLWVFWTRTPEDTQRLRLIRRHKQGDDHSDGRPGMVELQRQSFSRPSRDEWPEGTHLVELDTTSPPPKVLETAVKRLLEE